MRILIFSINPIYEHLVTGGASKHLYNIANHLGKSGHEVTILCTRAGSSSLPFTWSEGVKVEPILPFKQPFPAPYAISAGDLALIGEMVEARLKQSDRFYMHDGELLLPFLHTKIPTVISYRDNVYPESILGSFISSGDEIIAVSDYSAEVIKHTAGRIFPDLKDRVHVVRNGIDFNLFRQTPSEEMARSLGIDLSRDVVVLHPHRPEAGKGLLQSLRVCELLVKQYAIKSLKVLVPQWIPEMASDEEKAYYTEFHSTLSALGLRDHFVFHAWLSQKEMPAYYSLGRVTLSMGSFVEAFGNVAYESLACGTPSIVARVGVHRSNLPDSLINKVDYDDIEGSAAIAFRIIEANEQVSLEKIEEMKPYFDLHAQMNMYTDLIVNCQKRGTLQLDSIAVDQNTKFALAPWCYLGKQGIYHDFKASYNNDPLLVQLSNLHKAFITYSDVSNYGVSWGRLKDWYLETYIVPVR